MLDRSGVVTLETDLFSNQVPPTPPFFSYTTNSRPGIYLGNCIAAQIPETPAPMYMTFRGLGSSIARSEIKG